MKEISPTFREFIYVLGIEMIESIEYRIVRSHIDTIDIKT